MIEVLGYLGTLFVMLSYFSKDMVKLRNFSIIACVIFIIYAYFKSDTPIIITNIMIMGVNIYRIIKK